MRTPILPMLTLAGLIGLALPATAVTPALAPAPVATATTAAAVQPVQWGWHDRREEYWRHRRWEERRERRREWRWRHRHHHYDDWYRRY